MFIMFLSFSDMIKSNWNYLILDTYFALVSN